MRGTLIVGMASLALLACLAVPAVAAANPNLAGTWVLVSEDKPLMVFELKHAAAGWSGVAIRPKHLQSDCESISGVAGPPDRDISNRARELPDGVEFTIGDPHPAPPGIPDVVTIRSQGGDAATMVSVYTCGTPVVLRRVTRVPEMAGWDAAKSYALPIARVTNPAMTAIFAADQADRADPPHIDWKLVGPRDVARRAQTQALLDSGQLESGDDFLHAAFVFQHGSVPGDYLKAHTLALIAAARGKAGATWIAAATLDRYLQAIGQPQVFGTQFKRTDSGWTQEPYDRALLSDGLRVAAHVPALAEQQKQLRDYEARSSAAKK